MTLRNLLCRQIINYNDIITISGPNIENFVGQVISAEPMALNLRINLLEESFGTYTVELDAVSSPPYRDGDCPFSASIVNQITCSPITVIKFFEMYDKLHTGYNSTLYTLMRRVRKFIDITDDTIYYSTAKDLPGFLQQGYVDLIDCEGTFYVYGIPSLREEKSNE